ncbi:MFS transporter [Aquibacillus rhizosphaerae]|uniref:MFS transporter n=1 Tax=Aquibacillus rhizosphaerae TaxID=3051431 RepID=A0ABT7L6F8_9BACI|nr:MFS transporter [Aquibacillus sp. LR5S19]MDL4840994.1 MFS transporter [Aquibacillus sp. LR5S19]
MIVSEKNKVVGIALITAVAVMGDAMLFIVLPIYWREFGLTGLWQIGILLSINRFIRLPINPLVGLFYQHFQLRTGVLLAILLAALTTLSYGIFHQFWILVTMRALWGVAWSLLRLGGFLTVIEVTNDANRGRFVGLYNGLWGIGGLVGMLGGGLLVDQTSIRFVTSLFSIIGLLAIPSVWLLVPASQKMKETEKNNKIKDKGWLSPYLTMILITGLAMGFIVFGLFASTLSPLIEQVYQEDWTFLSLTIGAATLGGIIQAIRWGWDPFVAPVVGKLLDSSESMLRMLLIPLVAGGILFIILGKVSSIVFLITTLLIFQLVSTIFVTTTDTLATSTAAQNNRVKVMTAHTIVVDIGAALGPFLAFIVIEMFSLKMVYYIAATLLLSLGVLWLYFIKKYTSNC